MLGMLSQYPLKLTFVRLMFLTLSICCAVATGSLPASAQAKTNIRYDVVMRLPIPEASKARWSPDGSRLAVTAYPTIQIWDTQNWKLLQTIQDAPAISTKWNPKGDLLAGVQGGDCETVLVWDAKTGKLLKKMNRPQSDSLKGKLKSQKDAFPFPISDKAICFVHDLSWHPNGKKIATDSSQFEEMLLIWDISKEDNPQSLAPIYSGISDDSLMDVAELAGSQNGQWLLSSGSDGNFPSRSIIRLWNATTGEAIRTIFPGMTAVWGPNDESFAGLSVKNDEYVINIWDAKTGAVLSTFKVYKGGKLFMSWNFDSNMIAGARIEDHLSIWDVKTGQRYDFEDIQTSLLGSIEWRQHSNQLAIADLDKGVTILKFEFDTKK